VLFDRAKIHVEGGRGGNGVVSFRREAHVPRGGPDGGDGGGGGDVVLVCDAQRRDLSSLGRSRHFRAGRGKHGKGKRQHGERGGDRLIPVPPGTVVLGIDGSEAELLEDGQRLVVARGGAGGHGNKRFTTSTRQAPRFAERGLEGESGEIELRLKLLADVGLVGLPNAGKSSLLARLTRAHPKVADYPFTTVEPNLGTIDLDDRQLILADIPGLIEGAAEGAGLGHEFLAHVERCRLLVHLVEVAPSEGNPVANYGAVRGELAGYGAGLDRLPEIIALSKVDLIPDEEAESVVAEGERFGSGAAAVLAISSATGDGLDELMRAVFAGLPETKIAPATVAEGARDFEVEHRVYRPGEEEGFDVVAEGEGRWRVSGRGIEMLIARHDLENPEALDYLEGRLREIGVIAELQRAGFEPGDEVVVGDVEFELEPG
jgi:GTP-binding protein